MLHGHHWHCIHQQDEQTLALIQQAAQTGKIIDDPPATDEHADLRYLQSPDYPFGVQAILRLGERALELEVAFPSLRDLDESELEILSVQPDEDRIEAVVTAINSEGVEIPFHCRDWLHWKCELDAGGRFKVGLGALAYRIEKAATELRISEGSMFEREKRRLMEEDPNFDPSTFEFVTLDTSHLRAFFRREEGDFEFQSVVEEVVPFSALGTTGFVLRLNLSPEDHPRVGVKLYATTAVLGDYIPAVGESVVGVAWMQGMPLERIDTNESWLDSAEVAHASAPNPFIAAFTFALDHPHLPLALQAVGGALVGAGWEIQAIECRLFRPWLPAFIARRKDLLVWIYVRTVFEGQPEPDGFGIEDSKREAVERESGARCLWVTVTLEPCGKNYALTADGFGEFAEELTVSLEMCRPEEFEIVSLDNPDRNSVTPVLDEVNAATVFAEAFDSGDLREFSKLLVEDVEYISDSTRVRFIGRHKLLRYLGNRLDHWLEAKCVPTSKIGTIDVDGRERPCVFSYDEHGKEVGRTIFTGRKGHIAAIRNLAQPSVGAT